MHQKKIVSAGRSLKEAGKCLVMVHGRGGTAEDILSLSEYLHIKDFALVAPQAANNTWYPYSFLAPPDRNEPGLSSALALLREVVADITAWGIAMENIYFLGFSQGACLALEFVTRHATRWGGVAAFTGGLIGDRLYLENYAGSFEGTPIFLGTGDPDPHVSVERVLATAYILNKMNAAVTEKLYPGMGHTINQDEIDRANTLLFGKEANQ